MVLIAGLAASSPASAATLFCAPIAVTELIGEPGPMTISASDPSLGNPVVFWIDTETGAYQEHFDESTSFISGEATLEAVDGAGGRQVVFHNAEQNERYHIDLGYSVDPFYRAVDGALTEIGTCVASPMGTIPAAADAPIWPFPYQAKSKDKSGG
jgi:hypothetical protein